MATKFSYVMYVACGLCIGCTTPQSFTSLVSSQNKVYLENTQIFTLSASNQREYRIKVRYPDSYQTQTNKRYPVIIKIDGQWDFPLAASVVNNIYFDGQIPEVLVIGVDWVDTSPNLNAVRWRDLSPVDYPGGNMIGRAADFANVLADDVIPQLQQRLRANEQVYLWGGSLGGDFATYALLKRPDAFDGAVAVGGSHGNSKAIYEELLQSYKGTNALVDKRVYLGVGDLDGAAPDVIDLAKRLEAAQLAGLKVKLDVQQGYGHSGINVIGFAAGYRYLFERPNIALSQQQLKTLEGTYQPLNGSSPPITFRATQHGLVEVRNDFNIPLRAKNGYEFYREGQFSNVTFTVNDEKVDVKVETFFGVNDYSRTTMP